MMRQAPPSAEDPPYRGDREPITHGRLLLLLLLFIYLINEFTYEDLYP
jgi:hypothetical protein